MYWIHNDKEEPERLRKENEEKLRKEILGKIDKEDLEMLRKEGFTELVIARLLQMRCRYGQDEKDQAPLDIHRLEFARWLVATGRLTDQIK